MVVKGAGDNGILLVALNSKGKKFKVIENGKYDSIPKE